MIFGAIGGPWLAEVGIALGAVTGTAIAVGLAIGAELFLNPDLLQGILGAAEQPRYALGWWPL